MARTTSLLAALVVTTSAFAQNSDDAPASAPAPEQLVPTRVKESDVVRHDDAAPAVHSVVVLDFKADGDIASAAKAFTTLINSEVGQHPGYSTISRNELKSIIAHQADAQLTGCDEPRCAGDIGKLVNAKYVVAGALERTAATDGGAGAVVVSLSLVDTDGPTVRDRVTYTWRGSTDDLLDLARPAVFRLLDGKKAGDYRGHLEVLTLSGAAITVDDKVIGEAPVKAVRDLAIGVHSVEVRKSGYLPFSTDVAITKDDTRVIQVDLVDEMSLQPWYARWYVWGSALAGVVVIGGAAAAIGTYQYLSTPSRLVVGEPVK